ncbi:MAG TPA: 6-phosphogluconolactonase [Thermoanaerobaculia bacterium]|nr:6-phosphogluconolactonase [Thermoanaerobaculia bacterium]
MGRPGDVLPPPHRVPEGRRGGTGADAPRGVGGFLSDPGTLVVVPAAAAVARAAAEQIAARAERAVASTGRFTIALSGGSTPKRLYALLADPGAPYRARIEWDRIHVFFGDERHVPPDDAQSNFRMARETLLDRVPVPAENVHRVLAERSAEEAADLYEAELRRAFSLDPGAAPRFDVILLGMGEDGHTASLFPGTAALSERRRLVAANWVPKFSTWRITMTLPVLNAAAAVLFLVAGPDKARPLAAVFGLSSPPDAYPCQLVRPKSGELLWLVDRAAAASVPPGVARLSEAPSVT